ncbi:hypothetical protein HYZ97_02640 [Candidatus Pacearchaeota archaeon]|nr:hypothetical protein [Candidatus Pacearchaeota archaeon]
MNKWLEVLLGLILVIVPIVLAIYTWPAWWPHALSFLIGGIFWFVVGIGALFLLLGISDLKG